jgi:hypothetical protein
MSTQKSTPNTGVRSLFKQQLPHFKSMLLTRCKTRISTQNANDAMAVAAGYKDYQTAVGLGDKNNYTIRVNLGIKNNPFWISKSVGQHGSDGDAQLAAEIILRDCNDSLEWILFKDERKTKISLWSTPCESGLTLQISVNAERVTDIKEFIDEFIDEENVGITQSINHRVSKSFVGGYFKATFSGKNKGNMFDKPPHIEAARNYAVISENGVLGSCWFDNYFEKEGAIVRQQHQGVKGLANAKNLGSDEFDDALKYTKSALFSVFTIASKPAYFSGHGPECLTYMKQRPQNRFNIYQHI